MFELSPETTPTTGKLENKPDTQAAAHTSAETSDGIMIRLSVAELDALTDIVLNDSGLDEAQVLGLAASAED